MASIIKQLSKGAIRYLGSFRRKNLLDEILPHLLREHVVRSPGNLKVNEYFTFWNIDINDQIPLRDFLKIHNIFAIVWIGKIRGIFIKSYWNTIVFKSKIISIFPFKCC
jgi:hypothetical protein